MAGGSTATGHSSDEHFAVLDGYRGLAALIVLVLHVAHQTNQSVLPQAYLAVDFFYILSGFVVAYAYEARLERAAMSGATFMVRRLIRLYPLILAGTGIGIAIAGASALVDGSPPIASILTAGLLGLLLLPSYVHREWSDAYPFNMASWSLFYEVAINIIYAVVVRFLTNRVLFVVLGFSGLAVVALALGKGTLNLGWSQDTFGWGAVRVVFTFFAGVALYRFRPGIRPGSWASLALMSILMLLLVSPWTNAIIAAASVLFAFPWLVWAGASRSPGPAIQKASILLGRISYPLYILHGPILKVGRHIKEKLQLTGTNALAVDAGQIVVALVVAYAALRLFDEPVRKWLIRSHQGQRVTTAS